MCEHQRFISNTVARNSNVYKLKHVFEIHDGETKYKILHVKRALSTQKVKQPSHLSITLSFLMYEELFHSSSRLLLQFCLL